MELAPNNFSAWHRRSGAQARLGRWEPAISDARKAAEVNPRSQWVRYHLSWLLSNSPEVRLRDPKEAIAQAKAGVELVPREPVLMRALGVAHYRAGDMPAALEALEKALAMRPGGDVIEWYFMAMAHQKLGRAITAREFYDRATELMDRSGPPEEELVRFRAEAAMLLGVRERAPPPRPVPADRKK